MQNKRIYGIEIARIVSMYMIVMLHCLNMGGILNNTDFGSVNYYLAYFIENLCFGAVNIYALISGYVCLYSKNRFNRIINLWLEVIFYSFIITTAFILFSQFNLKKAEMIFPYFPVLSGEYWYFGSYICVFIAMPLLNKAVLQLRKQSLLKILLIGFILLSGFAFAGNIMGGDFFKVAEGYSPIWLMYLYLCGAYIRLYGIGKFGKYKILLVSFLAYLFNYFGVVSVDFIVKSCGIESVKGFKFLIYNSPLLVIGSLLLFCFFTKIEIKKAKGILKVSSVSFYVYIISTHYLVFTYIQKDMIKEYANSNPLMLVAVLLLYSFVIYFACTIIALIFKKIFACIKLHKFADFLVSVMGKIYHKIINILNFA